MSTASSARPSIAVIIPCYNEAAAVQGVVSDFRTALPEADIYVFDNNSTDGTAQLAAEAGAIVRREVRQGKGHVVRRMFSDVEADVYVLVDGDQTYEAAAAPAMVQTLLRERLDMVTGVRAVSEAHAYRRGHRFGNRLLTRLIEVLFNARLADLLSGYRILSRRFVKSFPVASGGFEIETELSVHALELAMPIAEYETRYDARPEGSTSKLNTFRDGWRILVMIVRLTQQERPLQVFGGVGVFLLTVALLTTAPVIAEYFATGLVPRFPTLIAAGALGVIGVLSVFAGAILANITYARRELRRLIYLQQAAPGERA